MITDGEIFETIAENTLNILLDRIDDVLGDEFDVDLNGGILNIELENGSQYVINKNAAHLRHSSRFRLVKLVSYYRIL